MAGEQAGFSVEQMIRLLNAGMTVETLLNIIERRLSAAAPEGRSSCWNHVVIEDVRPRDAARNRHRVIPTGSILVAVLGPH
jgi:hypothetical protein